jgi:hypothetical protein
VLGERVDEKGKNKLLRRRALDFSTVKGVRLGMR